MSKYAGGIAGFNADTLDGYHATDFTLAGTAVSIGTVRVVTASTTELTADAFGLIVCNKAVAMGVQLLAATGSKRTLQIANINDGAVTVTPDGADTINGEVTQIVYKNSCMEIKDYAANKWIIK